ncbi:WGR domain-containing protein [Ensifer sp. Root1252]|uniref:WGR domain-containing protein n=1 Tax=unclassified Ensifer TaxID=2633371 RepID=UPI0032425301
MLSIQPTLFGEVSLIRAWGRIGTRGQEMSHHFASETDALVLLRKSSAGSPRRAMFSRELVENH